MELRGSGTANSTAARSGSKAFNTVGTFTVTFTVTDSPGLADPTPATRTIQVNAAGNQAPNGVINTPAKNNVTAITVGQGCEFHGRGHGPG